MRDKQYEHHTEKDVRRWRKSKFELPSMPAEKNVEAGMRVRLVNFSDVEFTTYNGALGRVMQRMTKNFWMVSVDDDDGQPRAVHVEHIEIAADAEEPSA